MCITESRLFSAALLTNSECLAGPFLGWPHAEPWSTRAGLPAAPGCPYSRGESARGSPALATAAEVPVLYPTEQGNQDERVMLVDGPSIFQGQEKKLGSGPISHQGPWTAKMPWSGL